MNIQRSEELYTKAEKLMPGGVNSPVRACRNVGKTPLFIDRRNKGSGKRSDFRSVPRG